MKSIVNDTRWKSLLPTVVLAVFFSGITATRGATVFAAGDQPTVLGIEGTQFTLNGKPTFLLGISYYGALGASQDWIRRDLDDMERYGFNWLRVWAAWQFHDSKQDVGFVQAFRIRSSRESKQLTLKGIDSSSQYAFTDPYSNDTFVASGELLTSEGARFTLPQMSSQVLEVSQTPMTMSTPSVLTRSG